MSKRSAVWYFDFISPFAYLQWLRLREPRSRFDLEPRPILFAALLDHWGQKGPAEIPAKRAFTYQFVRWRAQRDGVRFRFPPAHPFNPLAALRLCIALDASPEAIDAIFDHVWGQGLAADDAAALGPVGAHFGVDVAAAIADPIVKGKLRQYTEGAINEGVFGVPTLAIDGKQFWGDDATPMFEQYLDDPAAFDDAEMRRLANLPSTAQR